jgi:hypothetical protein
MEINQLLGHWTCERGGRAEVRQTKKQGKHFYTRCECCGLNQGTGKVRQQAIYDNTEFVAGITVTRPSGVEEKSLSVVADQPEKAPENSPGDFDPNEPVDSEETEQPAKKSWLVPLVIFAAAVGAGLWS